MMNELALLHCNCLARHVPAPKYCRVFPILSTFSYCLCNYNHTDADADIIKKGYICMFEHDDL